VEPLPVEDFRLQSSDSSSMMMGLNQIISRWQVSDLRRKYKFGVPARVNRGLYALKIPWGYSKPPGQEADSQAVPIIVPSQAAIIREIKDLFLDGKSYHQIQAHLIKAGYATPTGQGPWSRSTIKKIISNPWYAGRVYFGRRLTVRDARSNTARLVANPNPIIKDGKHKPLYSWEEYQRIMIEVERRAAGPRLNLYPLTGLLTCSVCGKRIYHKDVRWWCKSRHVKISNAMAMEIIPEAISVALQNVTVAARESTAYDPAPVLADLERQRLKIQQAYESEIYTHDEAERRIKAINAQVKAVKDGELAYIRKQQERETFEKTLEKAKAVLAHLPEWIRSEEPGVVNALLLRLCREIVVTPEHGVRVEFRD
ncbi:MAG TPA: recombinase family protein, partial [Candidatus Binatia bacterium]|nr:recombinase family protein [Candidatus Binatia bacterium]